MQFLGFHAVEVEVGDGEFRAIFKQAVGEFHTGDEMNGKYLVEGGLVASACELRA